jgi:hypothetical protein
MQQPPSRRAPLLLAFLLLLLVLLPVAGAFNPHHVSRQQALKSGAAVAAAAAGLLWTPDIARGKEEASISSSKLYARFSRDDVKNPGIASFGSPTLLFLPPWMLGEFNATMTFDAYKFPLGALLLSTGLLIDQSICQTID